MCIHSTQSSEPKLFLPKPGNSRALNFLLFRQCPQCIRIEHYKAPICDLDSAFVLPLL